MFRLLAKQALGAATAGVDRAFVQVAFRSRKATEGGTEGADGAALDEAALHYPALDAAGKLFPAPSVIEPREARVRTLPGGEVVDLAWRSAFSPLHARHAELLARCPENATAHARWLRHHRPAPTLICLHGWGAGHFPFEELAYSTRALYRAGLDVVLVTLPFHARRGQPGQVRPRFPSAEPHRANEGFAQAVLDVRGLLALVRAHGARRVALTGMSLGALTSSLLATVEPGFDAVVPILPFGSLPELLWEHGDGTSARLRARNSGVGLERFAAAFRAVTPLQRNLVLPREKVLLIAARNDQITPLPHAVRLASHFGSQLEVVGGGHLVQLDRSGAFSALTDFLRRHDVL